MPSTLALLLFVCALQEPPPATALTDLRQIVTLNRPLLVDVQRVIDCRFDVNVIGKVKQVPMRIVDEWRFVDVHSVCGDGKEVCARQYLKTHSSRDGRFDDTELTGMRVDLSLSGGVWSLKAADHRVGRLARFNELLEQAPATSMWIPLPEDAPLDAEFDVEMLALLRTLLDAGKQLTASPARMRIAALEVAPDRARLSGRVACTLEEELPTGAIELACDLAVTLEIDRAERRLSRVRLDGKAIAKSKGLMDVTGGGRVTVEMKAASGEVATAAMRGEPKFRKVERRVAKLGLAFTAPSGWFDAGEEKETWVFARSVGNADGNARILLFRTQEKFDAPALFAKLRKKYTEAKVEPGEGPLGPTVRYEFDVEGERQLADVFALDAAKTLTFKLVAPVSLFPEARAEFEAIASTIRRVPTE